MLTRQQLYERAIALLAAGADYTSLMRTLPPFSATTSSISFDVEILEDDLTELAEFFNTILTNVSVSNAGNVMQSLSAQELSRILLAPDRARVNIIDDDCKFNFSIII